MDVRGSAMIWIAELLLMRLILSESFSHASREIHHMMRDEIIRLAVYRNHTIIAICDF